MLKKSTCHFNISFWSIQKVVQGLMYLHSNHSDFYGSITEACQTFIFDELFFNYSQQKGLKYISIYMSTIEHSLCTRIAEDCWNFKKTGVRNIHFLWALVKYFVLSDFVLVLTLLTYANTCSWQCLSSNWSHLEKYFRKSNGFYRFLLSRNAKQSTFFFFFNSGLFSLPLTWRLFCLWGKLS